jgi:hypothetical protein
MMETDEHFSFVFIPADLTSAISVHSASRSGGLEQDALRLASEAHFASNTTSEFKGEHDKMINDMFQSKGLKAKGSYSGLAASVEIIVLQLPTASGGFIGVSMYCDQNGKLKKLELNTRASSLCQSCGHINQIYGDIFVGRYHDDESLPWERLDFTLDDMNSDSTWIREARAKNEGRSSGAYSTSGVLQNMMKSDNTAVINGDNADYEQKMKELGDYTESEYLQWSQTSDEVELRIKTGQDIKKGDITVKIHAKKVQIEVRNTSAILNDASSAASQIFSPAGAELYSTIDPDCSAWTLDRSKNGDVTIVCTLAKAREARWPQLTA